jgi:hypothetical protein
MLQASHLSFGPADAREPSTRSIKTNDVTTKFLHNRPQNAGPMLTFSIDPQLS